jgi:YgiT-type zinc finger domain-containing protein
MGNRGLSMMCVICKHGETSPGNTTVTFERNGKVVIIQDVPAEICGNCGEYYLDEMTASQVQQLARESRNRGVELELRHYIAA